MTEIPPGIRAAQYRAARAASLVGSSHPLTRLLLAAAAAAATAAWEAGHRVADLHPHRWYHKNRSRNEARMPKTPTAPAAAVFTDETLSKTADLAADSTQTHIAVLAGDGPNIAETTAVIDGH